MDILTHIYLYGSAPINVVWGEPVPAFTEPKEK